MSPVHLRCLSGQTCHRNGTVVRTSEPWEGEGEVSERERYKYQPRRVESDTGCSKHVHEASLINTYKQRPLTYCPINQIHIFGMHPSFRVAHKPLISFIGKRQWSPGSCRVFFQVCVPTQR